MEYIVAISEKHWYKIDPLWTIKSDEEKKELKQKAIKGMMQLIKTGNAVSIFSPMDDEGKPTIKVYPTIERESQHIDNVGEAYEALKDKINDLLADLQPTVWNQKPINPRITEVFEGIQLLRDLACK